MTIFSPSLTLTCSSAPLPNPLNRNPDHLTHPDHTHIDLTDPLDPYDNVQKAIEIVGKAIEADTKGEYAVSRIGEGSLLGGFGRGD